MNLDDLTIELSKAMTNKEELKKAAIGAPPILAWAIQALRRRLKRHARPSNLYGTRRTAISSGYGQAIARKIEEYLALRELKKNEFMASVYDSGELKFDFGSAVPEKIKKMALAWAKKKGLNPVEVSLGKSDSAPSSVLCGKAEKAVSTSLCIKRVKYEVN